MIDRSLVLAFGAVLVFPVLAVAQSRGTTANGAFGQTTLGNPGGTSAPSFGTGMTTGMGTNVPGNVNAGQSGSNAQASQAGTVIQSGLVGGMQELQRGGQTGFVGLSAATAQNPFASGQGARGAQNFSMLSQLLGQSRQNQFNQQQAQRSQRSASQAQSQFRVPMRLGFQPPPVSSQRFGSTVSTRLTNIPGLATIGPIQASLEGRTAVLRGTVATESDRQLAEGLAMLEPEVLAVRNELVVGSPGTRGEALPPPVTP